MKKFLYFAFILMLILPAFSFCADEADPFASLDNNESTVGNNVTPADIFAGDTTTAETSQNTQNNQSGIKNAMSDNPQTGILQEQPAGGVQAQQITSTPVPVSKNESMFQSNELNIQQQTKTKQETEKDIADLFKEGKKYYDIEDYEGASEIWSRIVTNYPSAKNLFSIRYSLANAYEYSKQYDNAIVQYQKVLAEKPKAEVAIESGYRLAGCYTKLEKYPFAIEIYKDMILKNPSKNETIRAYFGLANVYMKQEKMKRVEIIYRNIMNYFPNSPWEIQARFQLASLYAQTNRFKSAIKEYKLIKYKFKDTEWAPRAAMHIGDTYKLAGDYKNAKDAYSRVMYEYYNNEMYSQQAEESIKQLKNQKEIETNFYGY
jgi:tetratricopeptide (TPR) repeat protein